MRIISGKFRKKQIFPPKNFNARPTTDMAKESLFNIIENRFDIEDLNVLDLFAGTGSISYEFASRYCDSVTCIEKKYPHYAFIKKTIHELNIQDQVQVIKADVFKYLNSCNIQYNLIFADPPYDLENLSEIPDTVLNNNLLSPEGLLIVEHSKANEFKEHPRFFMHKSYGSVNFSFFE